MMDICRQNSREGKARGIGTSAEEVGDVGESFLGDGVETRGVGPVPSGAVIAAVVSYSV